MAGQDWNVTAEPDDHLKISLIPEKIRDLKSSTKTIIQKEHVALGTDNSGGQHLKGATRVYLGDAVPTTDPESNNLDTAATSDDGRLAIVTAAATGVYNTLKVYMATAAGISTGWEGIRVAEAGTSSRVRLANAVSIAGYSATSVFTAYNVVCMSTGGIPRLASGLNAVLMPATAPSVDAHVVNKKYVDDIVGHDGDGYALKDVNGTPTKVYTKYLTGTLDGDATTVVAHSVTNGATKILSCTVAVKDSGANMRFVEMFGGAAASTAIQVSFDDANVTFSSVGSNFQSQIYRIKIDYIL